jgi:hypothetical protein
MPTSGDNYANNDILIIFEVVKSGQPFDEKRYVANLNNLPKSPFD